MTPAEIAHNELAYAVAHRTQLFPGHTLLDVARKVIELLEEQERIKAGIQAEANKALERYRTRLAALNQQSDAIAQLRHIAAELENENWHTMAGKVDAVIQLLTPAEPPFDHSARTTKAFKPEMGFCVCRHCRELPQHLPAAFHLLQPEPRADPDAIYRCDQCAPSFGCWSGEQRCSKQPPSIPEQIASDSQIHPDATSENK